MKRMKEHFVTCGQMKILERRADENGLSYYQMMENAGTQAANIILEKISLNVPCFKVAETNMAEDAFSMDHAPVMAPDVSRNVHIFCGKGNNGGDGFVVARKLAQAGHHVTVVLVDGEPVTADAKTNWELIGDTSVKILDMKRDDRALMGLRGKPDVIIDAIYGTGFYGNLTGRALSAVFYINKFYDPGISKIFALDIPSGMGGDLVNEKELDTNSVRANCTITFHARKPVHLQKFAAKYCGEILVADIGIDEEHLWNI